MNWDNQNKDPWGNKNDAPDFDELMKKFSSILGGKKSSSNGSGGGKKGSGFKFSSSRIFLYGLFAFSIVYASQCIYQLDASERAVILRFGKFYEEQEEGLNFRLAGIDERYIENVSLTRRYTQTNSMLTKDENIVDVTVSVQYQIGDPQKYVLDIRDADASLVQATESALRHVVGGSIMDDALTTGREVIAQDVKSRLQRYLDKYNTGLEVVIVNIEDSSPPNQVQAAFDDVIKAREDEVRARNEAETYANGLVPEARGQAQRMLQDAEAYKEQVVSEAEGDATRFDLLLAEYQKAPDVTRNRLYLESIQGVMSNSTKVMVDVEGGNNILYLPLDKIAQSTRGIEELSIPANTANNTSIRDLTNQVIEEIRRRNRQEERR